MSTEWLAQNNPPEVTPIDDLKPHISGDKCWCKPFYDQEVLVHNSMDGRETREFDRIRKKNVMTKQTKQLPNGDTLELDGYIIRRMRKYKVRELVTYRTKAEAQAVFEEWGRK